MSADQWGSLVPIVAIVLAFWFLVLRPARKRQVQAQQLQRALTVGDEVMLTSGIFGRIIELTDETLRVEVAPTVVVTAHRQAIGRRIDPEVPAPDSDATPAARSDSSTDSGGETRADDHASGDDQRP